MNLIIIEAFGIKKQIFIIYYLDINETFFEIIFEVF